MKYLINYSLQHEFVTYSMYANNERTLALYVKMLAKENAYNIKVEVLKNEQ